MIDKLLPYTKQSRPRLEALAKTLCELDRRNIKGDIVECGVWRGASIILARLISPQRICWMFDTFNGMTAPDRERLALDSWSRTIERIIDGKPANVVPLKKQKLS